MPKTKFQEFIFTLITSGCIIFIMGVYNVAIHTGGLQAATFSHALHSFPLEWFIGFLCAFFIASKTSKYFAFRVAKPTDPPDLHHPLHPDLHRLHNGTADEPAWNHRIFRNHFKSHLHLAPDHLPELHHSLPTADPGCRTILQIRIPSPVRISKSGK